MGAEDGNPVAVSDLPDSLPEDAAEKERVLKERNIIVTTTSDRPDPDHPNELKIRWDDDSLLSWKENKNMKHRMPPKALSVLCHIHLLHEAAVSKDRDFTHLHTDSIDELKQMLKYEEMYAEKTNKIWGITDPNNKRYWLVYFDIKKRIEELETKCRRRRVTNRLLRYETHYSSGAEGYPP